MHRQIQSEGKPEALKGLEVIWGSVVPIFMLVIRF